nr:ATP-binding cassette domain-containing protein [Gammaproteobacteria bacterium]
MISQEMGHGIALRNISKSVETMRGKKVVLRDVNYEFPGNRISTITGKSGSGKTTLLNIIGLLDNCFDGDLFVFGHRVTLSNWRRIRSLRAHFISFLFQDNLLFDELNVVSNIALPLECRRVEHKVRKLVAEEASEMVGIYDLRFERIQSLSAGERQRVALARSIVEGKPLLLMDEPTGNLDNETSAKLMHMVQDTAKICSWTVIIVTHDLSVASSVAHNLRLTRRDIKTIAEV